MDTLTVTRTTTKAVTTYSETFLEGILSIHPMYVFLTLLGVLFYIIKKFIVATTKCQAEGKPFTWALLFNPQMLLACILSGISGLIWAVIVDLEFKHEFTMFGAGALVAGVVAGYSSLLSLLKTRTNMRNTKVSNPDIDNTDTTDEN